MVVPSKHGLLQNASGNIFTEALVIKEVKFNWNEKKKALQKKGYNEKVILNMKRKMTYTEKRQTNINFASNNF